MPHNQSDQYFSDPIIRRVAQAKSYSAPLSDTQNIKAQALLERIVAQPPGIEDQLPSAVKARSIGISRSPVQRLALVGVTAAATIGITLVGLLAPGRVQPAFASWTPIAAAVTPEQAEYLANNCDPGLGDDGSGIPLYFPNQDDVSAIEEQINAGLWQTMETELVEVRGEMAIVVRSNGYSAIACLFQLDSQQRIMPVPNPSRSQNVVGAIGLLPPENHALTWDMGGRLTVFDSRGFWGGVVFNVGRYTPEVAGVSAGEIRWNANTGNQLTGSVVEATLQNGWWAFWVPNNTNASPGFELTAIKTDNSSVVGDIASADQVSLASGWFEPDRAAEADIVRTRWFWFSAGSCLPSREVNAQPNPTLSQQDIEKWVRVVKQCQAQTDWRRGILSSLGN